ncbi:hypothetical protein C2S53_017923 [Perilla frutescens var. hirtella]|uniref:Uncharacterized protein n=1 Tax=Perilla frutescens var. hirtella TaxID=608512 RepID=A0AAD4J0K9_PERFH|nr:hypothetical protein C2S53_017923 [Perilla frutescens var. hirtella]
MADRKSVFSRFWPPSSSRRTSTTQTAAPSPAATTSKPISQTSPTSAPPPRAAKASSPPAPTTPPRTEPRKADQPSSASSPETSKSPSGEVHKASQQTSTPSTDSKDEPRATTRSPSSTKPASPSRLSAQSRSPPQPSSPSHAAPQARSQTPQSPSTPKRASKPPSPPRITSRSPKQGSSSSPKGKQPASPSKGSTKPAASQQETPEMKEEVKPDSAEVVNGQTQEGTSFKHDSVEATPSQLSELGTTATPAQGNKSLDSSTVNGGDEPRIELDAKPEETKDVKEVVQAINTGANEETKKEVDDAVAPKSVSEKAEIPGEADQIHREKQEAIDTKEILATPANGKASQPTKRSENSDARDKPALPNGEQVPFQKNIRADMSKFANQMAKGDPKKTISDRPVSVITLAGENRGASMQMESDSSKREGPIHIHRSYKINPDESPEATTDGEEGSEGKKSEDERSMEDQLTEAYVNNNAQGINNSIVFNSSITEGSPGVHMVVSHLPKEPIQSKDKISCPETRKAEVNMSRAERLTYQPTVRRRCLRGLLLETSDSDLENPEKPRRHGCRVGCQKGDGENNSIDVL